MFQLFCFILKQRILGETLLPKTGPCWYPTSNHSRFIVIGKRGCSSNKKSVTSIVSFDMSAKDKYHDIVRAALESDGWLITDDPLRIEIGDRAIKIDLGAERLIGAEKGDEKIAVEIKSFVGVSQLQDFYLALGQFSYYQVALEKTEPERMLFLAVPDVAFNTFFREAMTTEVVQRYGVRLVVYEILKQKIILWEK